MRNDTGPQTKYFRQICRLFCDSWKYFTHRGDKRSLKFNSKKFEKFKDKIIYLIYEDNPNKEEIFEKDNEGEKSRKFIFNAAYRENGQRN